MYSWKNKTIKNDINAIKEMKSKNIDSIMDLNTLKNLKKYSLSFYTIKDNLINESEEYKSLKKYNKIINPIIDKYYQKEILYKEYYTLNKIKISKKDTLELIKEILNKININWYNTLTPIINNTLYIDYKYNNENYVTYISTLNKSYISLSKKNNFTDFTYGIHEFLHTYTFIKGNKFYKNIDSEFLSLLGELIASYEIYNMNLYQLDSLKTNLNINIYATNYINDLILRKYAIINNINFKNKINQLSNIFNLNKYLIKQSYEDDLEYLYDTIISYFIAIELFEIYKQDKEKCIYICDKLITDTNKLENKLKKYNIKILENEPNYIKTLKKEYIINNL